MSQQINLFNPIFLQRRKIFSVRTMAQALVLLLAGLGAMGLYSGMRLQQLRQEADAGARQLEAREARLATVKTDFAPRQKSAALEAELAEAERQLASLRQVSGVLARGELGNTRGYAEYFRAFARQHQDGLWLTGVSIAGAGTTIGVRGRALDARRVPAYLSRLTREPLLQGKDFGSLNIAQALQPDAGGGSRAGAAPYVEFSLASKAEGARP